MVEDSCQIVTRPKELGIESPLFLNTYDCPCGKTWSDVWDNGCDDDCPECGVTCSPTESLPAKSND